MGFETFGSDGTGPLAGNDAQYGMSGNGLAMLIVIVLPSTLMPWYVEPGSVYMPLYFEPPLK